MRTIFFSITAGSLMTALALAQPMRYTVSDLGPPGNPFSSPNFVNDFGLVTGSDTAPDGTSHAVLWYGGHVIDISQAGYGGKNSVAGPVNDLGLVAVGAETASVDRNNENFCDFGTDLQCIVFLWQYGKITPLPTLGGTNSGWGAMNIWGQVSGFAETGVSDPECPGNQPHPTPAINGTGPQVLDYEGVIWGPGPGQIRRLAPLPGDSVSLALGLNAEGQAVGVSGRCGNTVIPPFVAGPHAVLWQPDGSVHDLGSFGGTSNPAILAVGNAATAINDLGQVTGTSALPGNSVNQPFVWTKEKGMQHLQLLPGDVVGAGLAINDLGEVVGASISPGGPASGTPKAVLWANGAAGGVTNLNTFLTATSPFVALLTAGAINNEGQIAGFGVTGSGEIHTFLATPQRGQ